MNSLEAFYKLKNEVYNLEDEYLNDLCIIIERDLTFLEELRHLWNKNNNQNEELNNKERLKLIDIKLMGNRVYEILKKGCVINCGLRTYYPNNNLYDLYLNKLNICKFSKMDPKKYVIICDRFKLLTGIDIFDEFSYRYVESYSKDNEKRKKKLQEKNSKKV